MREPEDMKPVQIVLLVIAGALGGAILTRTWNKPQTKPPVTAAVQQPVTANPVPPIADPLPLAPAATPLATPLATPAAEPEPAPANPPKVASRTPKKPNRISRPAPPPPANPRPVETARVEPQIPAPVVRPEPAPAPVETTPPARLDPEPVAPPPPPPPNVVTLQAGTLIPVRLVDGLTSERNAPGDTFTATLDRPLVVDGFVIAERGARVDGRVSDVDRGGKVRGVAAMGVELTRIRTADGQTISVQTDAFERRAESGHTNDAAKVGIGAAAGAIIGAIAGGGKGAAIGAGVGGGAGAGSVLMTRGKPVTFPSETRINFRLRAPVTITEKR
jgi:hypothetical protein